jgi:L-ascorbate metabolism protein UlaG (beta-lactamase superfamily)
MTGTGIEITWLGHATVHYRSSKGKNVLVDAWVDGNPACPETAKSLPSIDLMLITHAHSDHFADAVALAKKHKPDVVCNFETSLWLAKQGVGKLHGMNKGGTLEIGGIRVTMVHAIHSNSIQDGDRLIPAGEPCGYVIAFENGTRVYHAGDTGVFGDMKLIGELYNPSIAALPIGDLFTMSPHEAAAAAKMLGVKTVIPIHYSTFPALTGTPEALRAKLADRPDIEVRALKPGETAR